MTDVRTGPFALLAVHFSPKAFDLHPRCGDVQEHFMRTDGQAQNLFHRKKWNVGTRDPLSAGNCKLQNKGSASVDVIVR